MSNSVNETNSNYRAALSNCDTLDAARKRDETAAARNAGILRVGRAIIALEQDEWVTPAAEWTPETFRHQGLWHIAEAAYDAALAEPTAPR